MSKSCHTVYPLNEISNLVACITVVSLYATSPSPAQFFRVCHPIIHRSQYPSPPSRHIPALSLGPPHCCPRLLPHLVHRRRSFLRRTCQSIVLKLLRHPEEQTHLQHLRYPRSSSSGHPCPLLTASVRSGCSQRSSRHARPSPRRSCRHLRLWSLVLGWVSVCWTCMVLCSLVVGLSKGKAVWKLKPTGLQ